MTTATGPHPEERRLATVLFADIQGFTALADQLDFEDASDLMNEVWLQVDSIIETHGGYIDKHIGDAVMAVWGAPQSREDDAERAVSAALAMQAALADYAARSPRAGANELQMRVALNTGPVLAGYVGARGEYTVMGDTVNVASRLERASRAGAVVISESTYRLVRGAFRISRLAPVVVKGKSGPLSLFEVKGLLDQPSRVRYRSVGGLETRMVARDAEMAQLNALYHQSRRAYTPVLALVAGEPGVGKSRLMLEFTSRLEVDEPALTLFSARCLAQASRVPFFVWKSLWHNRFDLSDTASPDTAREKFLRGVWIAWGRQHGPVTPIEAAHVIGHLTGLEWPDSPYLAALLDNPEVRVQRAFEFSRELLRRVCAEGPAVLVLDDLHWADSGSLDLLTYLLQPLAGALPLLIVGGIRPGFLRHRPQLMSLAEVIVLDLLPVAAEVVTEAYPSLRAQPTPALAQLARRAEGNPYFLEEMVKGLLQTNRGLSGGAASGPISGVDTEWRANPDLGQDDWLPETLQATLQARLDALSAEARSVALLASVVGRVFWVGAVQAAARQLPGTGLLAPPSSLEQRIQDGLAELVRAELVFPRIGTVFANEQEYIFKHSLLREVAYGMVPHKRRKGYHLAIAHWLAAHAGPDFTVTVAEHLEQAGAYAEAAQQYEQAATYARSRGATQEAAGLQTYAHNFREKRPETGRLRGNK